MGGLILNRFLEVNQRIADATIQSGRSISDVRLVTVTKGQSVEKINEVIQAGAKILGENYPEETDRKILEMGESGQKSVWHMIGHLQSRKIKFVVEHFSMIHSIDREGIASELNGQLQNAKKQIPALFEVNVSGEESKYGFAAWNEGNWSALVEQFLKIQSQTQNLKFIGLMTMPPFSVVADESRPYFKKCRKLFEIYQTQAGINAISALSMGTSLDFEAAIKEGSTFVRIGEAIMGKRVY